MAVPLRVKETLVRKPWAGGIVARNGEWISVGQQIANDGSLTLDDLPARRLDWLAVADSRNREPIFTVVDSRQIWW